MTDIFVSYSRRDKEFVQVLNDALSKSHYDTWIDWRNIPPTADWWQEIEAGIEAAHTFICVISADYVASRVCREEVDHATKHNKRIVPIIRRSDFSQEDLHETLAHINWVLFQKEDEFSEAFKKLVEVINTDLSHNKTHTSLQVSALKWDRKRRDRSQLIRGGELDEAEQWLIKSSVGKEPKPTKLQSEFVAASRKAANRQQRVIIGALSLLLVLTGLSGFAAWQWGRTNQALAAEREIRNELQIALERLEQAQRAQKEADQQTQIASAEARAALAKAQQQQRQIERLEEEVRRLRGGEVR